MEYMSQHMDSLSLFIKKETCVVRVWFDLGAMFTSEQKKRTWKKKKKKHFAKVGNPGADNLIALKYFWKLEIIHCLPPINLLLPISRFYSIFYSLSLSVFLYLFLFYLYLHSLFVILSFSDLLFVISHLQLYL